MRRITVILAAALLSLTVYAGAAAAANFNVTVTYDAVDAALGDGVCADAGGKCTLRAAVQEANALPGWDNIAVPGGVFPLTLAGPGEDLGATGDLDIRSELAISGQGPRRTIIDGQQRDRVLDLRKGSAAVSGVAVRNGIEANGAGIRLRSAKLSLRWAALYINGAPSSGAVLGAGGGIHSSDSRLSLSGVTLYSNRATEMGGAIYLGAPAGTTWDAHFENVTINGNSARRGGGIFVHTVPAWFYNLTIASNSSALGGGVYWLNIAPRAYNTTVAYNSGQDCSNAIGSAANNNDTDKTCGFFGPNDLPGVDPFLGPLTYLGVVLPNWVRTLTAASPLRDAGDPATCTGTDEVGQPRPIGPVCDIGAYEQP